MWGDFSTGEFSWRSLNLQPQAIWCFTHKSLLHHQVSSCVEKNVLFSKKKIIRKTVPVTPKVLYFLCFIFTEVYPNSKFYFVTSLDWITPPWCLRCATNSLPLIRRLFSYSNYVRFEFKINPRMPFGPNFVIPAENRESFRKVLGIVLTRHVRAPSSSRKI